MSLSDQMPLLFTNRNEVDGNLTIIEGQFPTDISGVFYVIYPSGSVNSDGLPFPEENPQGNYNAEYASPIMNGDGMLIMVNLNTLVNGKPTIKSRLMKTPCYWADYNSRWGTDDHTFFGFLNFGISRISILLGMRNFLNTAIIPARFNNSNPVLVGAYDVGRPWILDSSTLDLVTPIGGNTEWNPQEGEKVPWAFQSIQTTAHPSFDPNTQELFIVNYIHDMMSVMQNKNAIDHLQRNPEKFRDKLSNLSNKILMQNDPEAAQKDFTMFFRSLNQHMGEEEKVAESDSGKNEVWLYKFTGEQSPMEKWLLHDQNGNPIVIDQCMHQTSVTKDYIILSDSSFKFTLDLLVNNPFPEDKVIDQAIRLALSRPMETFTAIWLIERSTLDPNQNMATAIQLDQPIPVETIHFSCDYDNPDGMITLYGIHNSAMCIAEWLRTYDENYYTGQPIDQDYLSLFAIGSLDISRLGKWKIDAKAGKLLVSDSIQYWDAGNINGPEVGFNTWSLGLYGYKDMISPIANQSQIRVLYYMANGTDPKSMSKFIYNMYKDYPNRVLSLDDVMTANKNCLNFTLISFDTLLMKPIDIYEFSSGIYCRSLNFIPKTDNPLNLDDQKNGYLFCTVQVTFINAAGNKEYQGQYWIFDANNLKGGPICKMMYPYLNWCFTLHSAWIPNNSENNLPYNINIEQDYNQIIAQLPFGDRQIVQEFFNVNVYPNYQ